VNAEGKANATTGPPASPSAALCALCGGEASSENRQPQRSRRAQRRESRVPSPGGAQMQRLPAMGAGILVSLISLRRSARSAVSSGLARDARTAEVAESAEIRIRPFATRSAPLGAPHSGNTGSVNCSPLRSSAYSAVNGLLARMV